MHDTSWSGGEGCGFATETAEAPLSWEEALIHQFGAKPRGIQPSMSFGYLRPTMDSVKKRSLKRAIKRAARDGTCCYKGKMLHALRLAACTCAQPQLLTVGLM